MRENYKLEGPTANTQVTLEKSVVETLQKMSDFTQIPVSELVNTALRRFISGHKDFLPPATKKKAA
jgi:hypothetical protein